MPDGSKPIRRMLPELGAGVSNLKVMMSRSVAAAFVLLLVATLAPSVGAQERPVVELWLDRQTLSGDLDAAWRRTEVVAALFPDATADAERVVADAYNRRFSDLDEQILHSYVTEAEAAGLDALPDDSEEAALASLEEPPTTAVDTGALMDGGVPSAGFVGVPPSSTDTSAAAEGLAGGEDAGPVGLPGAPEQSVAVDGAGAEVVPDVDTALPTADDLPAVEAGPQMGVGGMVQTPLGPLVCPLPLDTVQFINDWHYPRSGGRVHMGNDLFSPEGTPLYAPQPGVVEYVQHGNVGLGGLSLAINTDYGGRWYMAHHSGFPPGIQPGSRVEAGQVVAYVGRTGNAASTPPHSHTEYKLPSGERINPYFGLAAACFGQPTVTPIGGSTSPLPAITGGSPQAGAPPTRENFLLLASCESGTFGVIGSHRPAITSASGKYRGAFQFDLPTWQSVGGTGDPAAHSFEDQLHFARILQSRRGWQPWPQCAPALGLL